MARGSHTTFLKRFTTASPGAARPLHTNPQALAAGPELCTQSLASPVSLRERSPLSFHYFHLQVLPPAACFREGKKWETGRVASR